MGDVSKFNKHSINHKMLKSLQAIMQDEYPEILQSFLDMSSEHHSQLHEAYESEDYEQLKFVCNEFCDACENIGANKLSDLISEMEQECRAGHYNVISDIMTEIDALYEVGRNEIHKEQQRYKAVA